MCRDAVPGAAVQALLLDLADLSSVRRAAQTLLESGRDIDVLLNNAGKLGDYHARGAH